MVLVRQIDADEWRAYRELRLEALQTDPGAFGSTYARESGFDEDTWRQRVTAGPLGKPSGVFVAEAAPSEPFLGTASMVYTEHHEAPMLVAMWVRPEARGQQLGHALVQAGLQWARDAGDKHVVLWVVQGNAPAIALYTTCGFEPTDNTDVSPVDPNVVEIEMLCRL